MDDRRLSRVAGAALDDPANELFVSAVAAYEIVYKQGLGRLEPLPDGLPRRLQRGRHLGDPAIPRPRPRGGGAARAAPRPLGPDHDGPGAHRVSDRRDSRPRLFRLRRPGPLVAATRPRPRAA